MRIRIALGTAVAVIVVAVPSVLTSLITSDPALAQATRHEAVGSHQSADSQHAVRINDKLMSYSQARQVAQEISYASAVEAAQQATFYNELTFYKDVVFLPGGRCPGKHHPGGVDAHCHL